MSELTLDALAKRVEVLEQLLHITPSETPSSRTWKSAVGSLGDDPAVREIFAEGQAIRQLEREAARRGVVE